METALFSPQNRAEQAGPIAHHYPAYSIQGLSVQGFLEAVYCHVVGLPTVQTQVLSAAMLLFILGEMGMGNPLAGVGWRGPKTHPNSINLHRSRPEPPAVPLLSAEVVSQSKRLRFKEAPFFLVIILKSHISISIALATRASRVLGMSITRYP